MSLDENERSSAYKTTRGAFYLMMKVLITSILASGLFIFIARFLPEVSDLGLVYGLLALIGLSVMLASLGLPIAASRFISSYIGSGKEDMAKSLHLLIFTIGLLSSVVISAILYISAYSIATVFFHNVLYVHLIHLASIDVFMYSMITFSIYLLYAAQQFRKVAVIAILNSLLRFAAAFVLLLLGLGVDGIVLGLIIGDVASLVMYVNALKSKIRRGNSIHQIKPLLKYSMPLYGSTVLSLLATSADNYLVLILSGLYAAGIYSPAMAMGTILVGMLGALGDSLLPYFSRIHGKSGLKSLSESAKPASRYVFLIYVPFGIATLVSAPSLITGIFGERYSESTYPAVLIILAITITSVGTVFNYIQISAGHTNVFLKSTGIGFAAQVAICIVTIPYAGALGAALARLSSYIIMFSYNTYKLKTMIGLNYDKDALKIGVIGSVIMASIIFALNITLSLKYYLPLSFMIGFLSYILFLRFTRTMNAKDVEVISSILPGKLRWMMAIITKVVIR